MNQLCQNSQFYYDCLELLEKSLRNIADKPEETTDTTLKALWWTAAGTPLSAESAARKKTLPELTEVQSFNFRELVEKRLAGIPLAHLTGRQQFMGIDLITGPQALIPRKETELLGYAALNLLTEMKSQGLNPLVVDVCTGAGNIPVALAIHLDSLHFHGADLSEEALKLAQMNIDHYDLSQRVQLHQGDLLAPFARDNYVRQIDLLTCNPPYISSGKLAEMDEEIALFEPALAFDGGPFGISVLRRLIREAPAYLKDGGWLAFEVGQGQGEGFQDMLIKKVDFSDIRGIKDDQGYIRVLVACHVQKAKQA